MNDPREIAGALRALADQIDPTQAPPARDANAYRRPAATSTPSARGQLYGGGAESSPCAPPFGRHANEPLAQLDAKDLTWYRDAVTKSLNDPERARYRQKNELVLADLEAELARR
jgi:hypothetical protein